MFEFLLSRVWLMIVALVLTVAVVGTFNDIDTGAVEQADMERAQAFADLLVQMDIDARPAVVMIEGQSVFVDDSVTWTLRNGSIWISRGAATRAVECPVGLTMVEKGMAVDNMVVGREDVLRISSNGPGSVGSVQVEKVDATSSTASMNLRLSSIVL